MFGSRLYIFKLLAAKFVKTLEVVARDHRNEGLLLYTHIVKKSQKTRIRIVPRWKRGNLKSPKRFIDKNGI